MEERPVASHDPFFLNSRFPRAEHLFAVRSRSLQELREDCVVVLDTNVLLTLYEAKTPATLEDCGRIYRDLSAAGRLIIPGQVAREFVIHRSRKLGELYQQISSQKLSSPHALDHPVLSSFEETRRLSELQSDTSRAITRWNETVDSQLAVIEHWNWNDPVSTLYRECFVNSAIHDAESDRGVILQDLERRIALKIPPGYEDKGKEDRGLGDVVIWHTIIDAGKHRQCNMVFVSHDRKKDWWHKVNGHALYPRFELLEEYWRASDGKIFQVASLADLVETFGGSEAAIEEVREIESQSFIDYAVWEDSLSHAQDVQLILTWVAGAFGDTGPFSYGIRGFDFVFEHDSRRIGVSVVRQGGLLERWLDGFSVWMERLPQRMGFASLAMIVFIVDEPSVTDALVQRFEARLPSLPMLRMVIGLVWRGGFLPIRDVPGEGWRNFT